MPSCLEYRGHQERLQEGSKAYFCVFRHFVPFVLVGFALVSDGPMVQDLCEMSKTENTTLQFVFCLIDRNATRNRLVIQGLGRVNLGPGPLRAWPRAWAKALTAPPGTRVLGPPPLVAPLGPKRPTHCGPNSKSESSMETVHNPLSMN